MTQLELAHRRLIDALDAEYRKPDCYLPQHIISAFLNVLAVRKETCIMCGDDT